MKILIAGAGGVIGTRLTRALLSQGHEILALTRNAQRGAELQQFGAAPVLADVFDLGELSRKLDGQHADAVINQLTDLKKPPTTHRRLAGTNRLRTEGTKNLVQVAAKLGACRFVTQSMLFGYGYGRAPDRVLTETDPFAPTGEGKFEQHLAAMRINESVVLGSDQFDGIALRYGLFYGVGAGDSELVKALRRRAMPVARSARPLSWIYIDDAVTATVAALEHGRGGQAYNVVDDEPATWTQMMTELAKQIGAKPPVALPGWALAAMPYAREVMRGGVRASNARAKAELGWSPAFPTFRDGVAQIAAAFAGRPSAASA